MQASQPLLGKEDPANPYNTPRILELDINRMLIGQNNIRFEQSFNNFKYSWIKITQILVFNMKRSADGASCSGTRMFTLSQATANICDSDDKLNTNNDSDYDQD